MSTKKVSSPLKSMLDIYQQPFVLVDRNFNIVDSNKAYAAQYNLLPDDIVGRKCHQVSPTQRNPAQKLMKTVRIGACSRAGKSKRHCTYTPVPIASRIALKSRRIQSVAMMVPSTPVPRSEV